MSDYEAAMLDKMQMLAEALDRAEAGVATRGDWDIIRMECGVPRSQNFETETWSEI